MMRLSGCVMFAALLWAAPAYAAPLFTLLPASGNLTAGPGETLGWGYEIVNDDPVNWLVISSLNADGFEHGTITDPALLFEFPIVAPGESVVRPYVPGMQGLYEFTWNVGAPAGFSNSGLFLIGAEFWDGDPFLGGQFASLLPDFSAAYDVSTPMSAPAPVPEPATLLLLGSGLTLAALSKRARRPKYQR